MATAVERSRSPDTDGESKGGEVVELESKTGELPLDASFDPELRKLGGAMRRLAVSQGVAPLLALRALEMHGGVESKAAAWLSTEKRAWLTSVPAGSYRGVLRSAAGVAERVTVTLVAPAANATTGTATVVREPMDVDGKPLLRGAATERYSSVDFNAATRTAVLEDAAAAAPRAAGEAAERRTLVLAEDLVSGTFRVTAADGTDASCEVLLCLTPTATSLIVMDDAVLQSIGAVTSLKADMDEPLSAIASAAPAARPVDGDDDARDCSASSTMPMPSPSTLQPLVTAADPNTVPADIVLTRAPEDTAQNFGARLDAQLAAREARLLATMPHVEGFWTAGHAVSIAADSPPLLLGETLTADRSVVLFAPEAADKGAARAAFVTGLSAATLTFEVGLVDGSVSADGALSPAVIVEVRL